ncbi:riboflavin kinase [Robertmurraya massiliosenegalensis]|uniref:riboflavin kinase n=1 Tax=Robertmurraya TaxID=2837507 RepID=UPI0039A70CFD
MKNEDSKISSNIRHLIQNGEIEEANSLLNHRYTITGLVVHGQALGRELGFPTANMQLNETYVLPKAGIYVGKAVIQEESSNESQWNVLISAGYRPTVKGKDYLIEVHFLDFSGDLYDRTISVSFLHYLREEIKFDGLDPLIEQMNLDKLEAKRILEMDTN